ncbi:2-hydroxyacyl-CoA dehydratase [Thiocystis minor]|uniref:2-hydroxyacyl-CoA dehydratase n=1 Tax=Thiocystis minor TaxID=61597 RepID=UPI0019113ABF|nr:2-hydroxyacyl-CoA dehydratase [Thiocystis minor]
MTAELIARLRADSEDQELGTVRRWQALHPGAPLVGYLPGHVPRELIYAAGGLAVGLWGAWPGLEIIQGDACFQSYICHLPRSLVEMAQRGLFADFAGLIVPSSCDVLRNLSGIWKLEGPRPWCFYLDLPQNFDTEIGGVFLRAELLRLATRLLGHAPEEPDLERVRAAIVLTNRQQDRLRCLRRWRRDEPQRVPIDDYLWLIRGALFLHPTEHIALLETYLETIAQGAGPPWRDSARVLLEGAFCEQPPAGLLKTIEQAGCAIVEEDLLLGLNWLEAPLREDGDPLDSLVEGYLRRTRTVPFKYQDARARRGTGATGSRGAGRRRDPCRPLVLRSGPARAPQPERGAAAGRDSLYTIPNYSEQSYQPLAVRELVGTFSDAIRLWSQEE